MAQKVHIVLEDDLDGSPATETVSFGLDGKTYEIDLNDKNAGKLRDALAQYVGAGPLDRRPSRWSQGQQRDQPGPQRPRGPRLGPVQRLQGSRPRPHPGRRTLRVRRRQLIPASLTRSGPGTSQRRAAATAPVSGSRERRVPSPSVFALSGPPLSPAGNAYAVRGVVDPVPR